ncbi:MAG: MFS transporter, partial [Oceanococcaceae bacterium]
VDDLAGLLALQLLHLSSFGLYHACAVNFIHREFGAHLQGRGQALHVSLSFGLGGATGSLVAGALWDVWGPEPVFRMAALAALLATLIAWRWVR